MRGGCDWRAGGSAGRQGVHHGHYCTQLPTVLFEDETSFRAAIATPCRGAAVDVVLHHRCSATPP
eukprot:12403048-Karenia_brevis.AAC.1